MPKYRIEQSEMELKGRAKRQWDHSKHQARHSMLSADDSADDGFDVHTKQKRGRHEKKWKDF